MHTIDTVRIPWFGLLNRAKEHFVEAERIGTVLFDNHIRIHNVEH